MVSSLHLEIARLILAQRWGAVATLNDGAPLASMVAYAPEPGLAGLLLFLSGLAPHTRNLASDPRTSLVVAQPDPGTGDPQTLPRVSLQGRVTEISREAPAFEAAWGCYVARFPEAAPRLGLGDFVLLRLVVDEARYVGGFARAVTLGGDALREAGRAVGR
jgi:putative heme iron utilization protein